MWDNFFSHSVKLSTCNDISFKSTNSFTEKKTSSKQIEFERQLSLHSDTDFQTFRLPLEQDFTKSSKGYASLLTREQMSIRNKEIKSLDCKSKSEKSTNVLSHAHDFSETGSTCSELFHKCSSYFNDQKYALPIHETLDSIGNDQTGKNNLLKSNTKTIHKTQQNTQSKNHISEKQVSLYSKKCIKTVCNYSTNLSNTDRLIKSDDNSSEIDIGNKCNNSQNFDISSSSDDYILSEKVIKNNNWCSSAEFKHTFFTNLDSESSEDDCSQESKENTTLAFSEDFAFECNSVDFLKNSLTLERNVCDSVIACQSEGYVNASFEDDFLTEKSNILKSVNETWNDSMRNISREAHESKRVYNYKYYIS